MQHEGTTRRERMEARAARREEWAAGRRDKAAGLHAQNERYRGDIAFNTQPGHIPERARVIARSERAFEHTNVAASHDQKAAGIRSQLDRSIFDDDPDARERVQARIAGLEAERDRRKAANVEYRKAHRAELQAMTKYERDQALPAPGWSLTNLGANIRRYKARLAALDAPPKRRTITARRDGECEHCGEHIEAGTEITKIGHGPWLHDSCAEEGTAS